jgi:hypothetical protein
MAGRVAQTLPISDCQLLIFATFAALQSPIGNWESEMSKLYSLLRTDSGGKRMFYLAHLRH